MRHRRRPRGRARTVRRSSGLVPGRERARRLRASGQRRSRADPRRGRPRHRRSQQMLGPGARARVLAGRQQGSRSSATAHGVRRGVRRLAARLPPAPASYPAWSPGRRQARRLARSADGVHRSSYVLGLADGSTTQLTDLPCSATMPAWSPDGATIAFVTPTALATVAASSGATAPIPLRSHGRAAARRGRPTAGRSRSSTRAARCGSPRRTAAALTRSRTRSPRPTAPRPGRPALVARRRHDRVHVRRRSLRHRPGGRRPPASRGASRPRRPCSASLPDWQPAVERIAARSSRAPPGPNDTIGCDWNPGVRVEILDANVSPSIVTVAAPKEVVFVNHLTRAVTVTTTLHDAHGEDRAGPLLRLPDATGRRTTSPSRGIPTAFRAAARSSSTAAGHVDGGGARAASLRLADACCRERPARRAGRHDHGHAPSGRSRVDEGRDGHAVRRALAPRRRAGITTTYEVAYDGATAERLLRVMPNLRVSRNGRARRASP